MKRSYLEILSSKTRQMNLWKSIRNTRIFVVDYMGRNAKKYFDTLDVNKITDNKAFWKNIKHLFSEKRKFANKITPEDSEENILSDDALVSEELNSFFQNATKTLNMNIGDSSSSITDPVDKAINIYKNHPSILLIKHKLRNVDNFSFKMFL